jgi:gamma-glutamylcysteine synthetase
MKARGFGLFCGGMNPNLVGRPTHGIPIDRYTFLASETRHHFKDAVTDDFDWFRLTAQNSPHVDVGCNEAAKAFCILNTLSGLLISLFANSGVWRGVVADVKCLRSNFYELMYPDRREFLGFPERSPHSLEEYVKYILDAPAFMIERAGRTLRIKGGEALRHFMRRGKGQAGYADGVIAEVLAEGEDLLFGEAQLWTNARLRSKYATIEVRCICQQPARDLMCPSAIVLGLVSNLDEARQLVMTQGSKWWRNLHDSAVSCGMEAVEKGGCWGHLTELIRIAERGLARRGNGEESLIAPLKGRLVTRCGPADLARRSLSDGVEEMITRGFYT